MILDSCFRRNDDYQSMNENVIPVKTGIQKGLSLKIVLRIDQFRCFFLLLSCSILYSSERMGMIRILFFLLNRDQFNLKNKSGIGSNHTARSPLSIGKIWRNEEPPFRPFLHEL